MSTRNCCDEVECVDSLDERKKLEECSEISVDSSGKLTTNSLRKTTESCLASERMALKEMKQGEDWTESFEDGKDFDCCNLIDTSESVVADNDCDVSQEEECYDRNESETFAFESTSNPHLETPSWVVEKPTNRSNDWLSRKKKMCRSIDENLLDTLAFTCGSVVSPIASSLEHSGRCNETSESSPGEVADNDSLFHIEEDNDMFVQLFKLDSSYDSSDVVRVDNLIHLSSDEEKVI